MKIVSPSFKEGEKIPRKYTCQGADINPALEISDVPKEAKSLALVMEDPDVPKYIRQDGLYIHWIFYNMDPKTKKIPEASALSCLVGKNTEGKKEYKGPCPPDREHRYFFTLYALDTVLDLPEGVEKEQLVSAMKGHILEEAVLMGLYEKSSD